MMIFTLGSYVILVAALTAAELFENRGAQNCLKPMSALGFIAIALMSIHALRLPTQGPLLLAMIGAVMFAVSDVFVGRDRFVSTNPKNALAITPLYFGAQALIALSMQG